MSAYVANTNFTDTTPANLTMNTTTTDDNLKIIDWKELKTKNLTADDINRIINDLKTMGVRQETVNYICEILEKNFTSHQVDRLSALV